MTDKEAAVRTICGLPDDASWDDILEALLASSSTAGRNGSPATTIPSGSPVEDGPEGPDATVNYHLEQRGRFMVLVPDRPVPPLSATVVNDVIEEMRREREDRWLGLTDQDGDGTW